MRTQFSIQRHTSSYKQFRINVPSCMCIELYVDFDDVAHSQVNKEARVIVNALNESLTKILWDLHPQIKENSNE